jgi:cytochrome c biogenesis protein
MTDTHTSVSLGQTTTPETPLRDDRREPPPDPPRRPVEPTLGFGGTVRFLWTQLTSMRTALTLLFVLAVAAIPGSLVPQRNVSPFRVSEFIEQHPTLGPAYDKLGLFHVYSSPWFSAVYALLFLSLMGCIVPRIAVYARAVRGRPPAAPRNLARLPAYAEARVDAGRHEHVLDAVAADLRAQRYRVVVDQTSVAAERGYLREAGNLVFHVSLVFLLLGVALGGLYGFRGTSVVISGQGFSNNLTQYDDITAGGLFQTSDLAPFTVEVSDFDAKFETGPVQRGAARLFEARVRVTESPGEEPRSALLEVNHPLEIDGTTVHLIGHGYAPEVTVKDGDGNVAFSGPVVFLPQDGNFASAGVIKAPDGRPERLAFEGLFLPTAVLDEKGPRSVFPDVMNPALFLNVWSGPPREETGLPENIYSLNTDGLTQVTDAKGDPVRVALTPGESFDLPGGGSITLDGWTRWVKLQIGDTPGAWVALGATALAVAGLCLSLFIRPRRLWVRVARSPDGPTLVQVGGLDRADARAGLTDDVEELAARIARDATREEPAPR